MKQQRGVLWPYALLSVALLGALGFGWYQTRQKNQLALQAENKYMSDFHRLKWTSENIEERTSRLMATNDPRLQESMLADLRVFSAQAVEHMAGLPFSTLNTPRIEHFLKTMRNKSDEYHEKVNRGTPLSSADWAQLTDLRKQSVFFESELGKLLGLVSNGRIRWADTAKVTGPTKPGNGSTPITSSMLQLEKALQPPPGEEQAMARPAETLARPKIDPGPRVSQADAVKAIRQFVDTPLKAEPVLTGKSDPEDRLRTFSLYFFNAQKANGTPLNFGVSIHGGRVIYMIDGRPVREKRFQPDQLVDRARQMLGKWGYPEVELISRAENDGTLVMNFAPREQGVAINIDMVRVMLAMDNGELVGFDARPYWVNRQPRSFEQPRLTASEAQTRVSPRVKVEGQPVLSLIADRRSKERLVWAVRGGIDEQRYRIYVDANTGDEVDLIRVVGDPTPPMNEGQRR